MIIQAIGLLDDFHKELNTYAMRAREWYGWHFPELAKILQDNILYAKAVKLLEARLRNLAGRELGRSAGLAKGKPKIEAHDKDKKKGAGALITAAKTYNPSADSILGQMEIWNAGNEEETVQKKRKAEPETLKTQNSAEEVAAVAVEKNNEKKKQKESNDTSEAEGQESIKKDKKEKKKKKKKEEASNEQNDTHNNEETGERKKKKRKHAEQDEDDETEMPGKKKEKKNKKIKKEK